MSKENTMHTGVYRVTEYAKLYRVSRATVYHWMQQGWLGSIKIGGCRRILSEHDEAFQRRFMAESGGE